MKEGIVEDIDIIDNKLPPNFTPKSITWSFITTPQELEPW